MGISDIFKGETIEVWEDDNWVFISMTNNCVVIEMPK